MNDPALRAEPARSRATGHELAAASPMGRVLRVKDGYNPNSSSVGSAIPTYLVFAAGSGALTVLVLQILSVAEGVLRKRKGERPPSPAEERSPRSTADGEPSREKP